MTRQLAHPSHDSVKRPLGIALCASLLILLGACTSDSDDSDSGGSGGSMIKAPVIDVSNNGSSGIPASQATEQQLRTAASTNAGKSLAVNIGSMQRIGNSSAAVDRGVGLLPGDGDSQPLGKDGGAPDILADDIGGDVAGLIEKTMGLTGGNATSTRTGDQVLIDPDEAEICQDELLGMNATQQDFDNCVALLAGLTVQLNAVNEDTGTVTYLFEGEEALSIDYAPNGASYEVKLPVVASILMRADKLDPNSSEDFPDVIAGSIRVTGVVTNENTNAEAGLISLEIVEALNIVDNDEGTSISLAPSTLFVIESDSAAGTGSIDMNIGALTAALPQEDDFGNSMGTALLSLAGVTGRIEFTDDADVVSVSNLGLGGGPLTVTINNEEAVRLTTSMIGFVADGNAGSLRLTSGLDVNLIARNIAGFLDGDDPTSALSLALQAPNGTGIGENAMGQLQVTSGGPLNIDFDQTTQGESMSIMTSISNGQCLGVDENTGMIAGVSC